MNSHFKKNIPVQFLTFVVDADDMIIPIIKPPKERPAPAPPAAPREPSTAHLKLVTLAERRLKFTS